MKTARAYAAVLLCVGLAAGPGASRADQPSARADKSWWSLQPLADLEPPLPPGIPESWAASAIDRFVYAKLVETGLQPSPPVDRRTLIRRASYDLIGLPPTPEDVEAFVHDPAADAYEKVIDRLLASPHYGERWGRHWLDVVRFGESTGFERNVIIQSAWPYRDYVIRSFNEDKPFNQLVLEHLAGDVIGQDRPDVEVGTTFLVAGPYDNVGNQDAVQQQIIRANTLDDMITATSTAFLGLTVGCARCHDHKFDPIPTEDYYRLQAVFAGVQHGERTIATPEERRRHAEAVQPLQEAKERLAKEKASLEDAAVQRAEQDPALAHPIYRLPKVSRYLTEDRFGPLEARHVRLKALSREGDVHSPAGLRIDEFEVSTAGDPPRNVALAANGARVQAQRGRTAEDFAGAYVPELTIDGQFDAHWIAGSDGTLTITLARPEVIERVVFSSDRLKALPEDHRERLFVGEYTIEVSLDGQTWTKVADSYDRPPLDDAFRRERLLRQAITPEEQHRLKELDRQLAEVDEQIRAVPALQQVWAGTFQQPTEPTYVLKGGDPPKKAAPVRPGGLAVLDRVTPPFEVPDDAPEGQRRLALAQWIVRDDNPLTARVLANRVWHYHFGTGIVDTPSDFGYLGGRPTHPELLDRLARRLQHHGWRLKPLHREILLSQTYRQASQDRPEGARVDQAARFLWRFPRRRLSAEEIRDSMLFIAGKLDTRMGGPGFRLYKYLEDNVATYVPLDQHGPETHRRAVYHQNARAARMDLLTDFDCPDNAFPAPSRAATTSPLQTLTLMNHRFTMDMARFFAERLQREAGQDQPLEQVRRGFALAYGRPPSPTEAAAALDVVRRAGLRAFCRAILNSNELIYLD